MVGPADAVNKAPTSAAADGSLGDMLLVRRSRLELEKEAAATAQAAHYGSPSKAGPSTGTWDDRSHTSCCDWRSCSKSAYCPQEMLGSQERVEIRLSYTVDVVKFYTIQISPFKV